MESVKDTILTIKQAAQRSRVNRARIDAAIASSELKFMKLRIALGDVVALATLVLVGSGETGLRN